MSNPDLTAADYAKYFASGALCATVTHGSMTPIDVVKTSIQIKPELAGKGLFSGARSIVASGGPQALLTGFGPTAVGYLVQGGGKFAGYEFWKKQAVEAVGGIDAATPHRTAIYLGAASVGEFFADILLTPLEATRIRLVSQPSYASGLASGLIRMAREGGFTELYAGFVPILLKQVPYAIGQFTVNEWAHEQVARVLEGKKVGKAGETSITLGCGIVAGCAASILSQPADTLLSMINKQPGEGSVFKQLAFLARQAGFAGLFSGTGPRLVMTSGLVASQFLLYDGFKAAFGARSGVEIAKVKLE